MSRKSVLANVRRACPGNRGDRPQSLQALGDSPSFPLGDEDRLQHLQNQFAFQQMRFARIDSLQEVPDYLLQHCNPTGLEPLPVASGDCPFLEEIPWQDSGCVRAATDAVRAGGVALSVALCAVAESGSLVLGSSDANPTTLNFLPERHVILFAASDLVTSFEEMWDLLRRRYPEGLPRAINIVSAPSSTGDVEMTLTTGVHGPLECHALMLGS